MNFVEEMKWRGMIHDIMPGTEEQLEKEVQFQIRWQFKMLELMTLLPPKKQDLFSWSETISSEEIQQQIRKIRSLYNQRSVISKWWRPSYALLAKHVTRRNSLHHFNWHTHWKKAQSKSLLETTRLRKLQRAWTAIRKMIVEDGLR